jgi:plastocyanin
MRRWHLAIALLAFSFAWAPVAQAGAGNTGEHVINMVTGHLFQPVVTLVKPGDTIIFDNKDKDLHALTLAGHEKLLEEEYIDPGKQFRFKVPEDADSGTWLLDCYIHINMKAKIIIDAN